MKAKSAIYGIVAATLLLGASSTAIARNSKSQREQGHKTENAVPQRPSFKPGNNGNHNGNNGNHNGNNGNHNGNNGNHNGWGNGNHNNGHNARPHQSAPAGPTLWNRPQPPKHSQPVPKPHPYHSGQFMPPPVRPSHNIIKHNHRPIIPQGYRPRPGAPIINGILGLAFGTAFNATLNYLYAQGYAVDGYTNGNIYLRNVNNMGYGWEDAVLGYTAGALATAQFINGTGANNPTRYYQIYNNLCALYGAPISWNGGMQASWFDPTGASYITLSFAPQYYNGFPQYYTTLTYSYR